MEYQKIIAQKGDVIQWNGSCPITNEVLSNCDKGAVINHAGNFVYVPPEEYTVVGTMKKGLLGKRFMPISEDRLIIK